MKREMLAIILISCLSINVIAQSQFGIKGGLNLASVTETEMGTRTSFVIGGFTQIELAEKINFQPELLFSMQGARETEDGLSLILSMNYVNVPLMFQFGTGSGFFFQAGPQVGFLTNANLKMKYDGDSESQNVTDDFQRFDAGLNIGFGYYFDSGVIVDARYNHGLVNAIEDNNLQNRVIQITLGYRL